MTALRILYVGETWQGSSARSMREALAKLPNVFMDEVGEDHYFPKGKSLLIRGSNRLLRPWHCVELEREVDAKLTALKPDILMVYKGYSVSAQLVQRAKRSGVFTVNIFPDYSPHAYGPGLQAAIGEYNLVVSTKPFHPAGWKAIYCYNNRCVCVPHGYDPTVHFWADPPGVQDFDVVLAATWRPQYHVLMQQLVGALGSESLRVGIIGSGWYERSAQFPSHWVLTQSLSGRAYGEWLRRGRIVIAPVNQDVMIRGSRQPGDEDSTRTYELAAAGCFFLHRRTPFAQTVYDEVTEVPMWDDATELAMLIHKFLPVEAERRSMAARAHARGVPAYSIPGRAKQVLWHVATALNEFRSDRP